MDNRHQAVKMEDPIQSFSFTDCFAAGDLDYAIENEKGSLGFLELLGVHEIGSSTSNLFRDPAPSVGIRNQTSLPLVKVEAPYTHAVAPQSPEPLNAPATPNSSSISCESTGAPNDDVLKPTDVEEEQHKTKKLFKPKKSHQKREREPRFAFMTKSEVDHLEDGYRWRKYGQKAVKNSPFPRSYYRCTTASCNVKKRIERSFNDPSILVTTYEGQHTHPSPMMHRPSSGGVPQGHALDSGYFASPNMAVPIQITSMSQQLQFNNLTPLYCGFTSNRNFTGVIERHFCTPPSPLVRDDGLLQDIVPSTVRNKD